MVTTSTIWWITHLAKLQTYRPESSDCITFLWVRLHEKSIADCDKLVPSYLHTTELHASSNIQLTGNYITDAASVVGKGQSRRARAPPIVLEVNRYKGAAANHAQHGTIFEKPIAMPSRSWYDSMLTVWYFGIGSCESESAESAWWKEDYAS